MYNDHATYTYSNGDQLDNYIKWKPPLDRCGRWELFAFLPFINTDESDTANATYIIQHRSDTAAADAEDQVVVNLDLFDQQHEPSDVNRWYSLGTYLWSKNANSVGEYVLLGDMTCPNDK